LGGSLGLAARNDDWGLEEAGVRAVVGKVRTFPDGDVRIAAAQVVFRSEMGAFRWTAAIGPLDLRWPAGLHRFAAPLGEPLGSEVKARFITAGLGAVWGEVWPLEVLALGERLRRSGATGGDLQIWTGPRARRFWPRIGLIQQRILPYGAAPVNGDDWWFTHAAVGTRARVLLPLGGGLTVGLSHLKQRSEEERQTVRRTQASVAWRF
jgi:hypothetical protein